MLKKLSLLTTIFIFMIFINGCKTAALQAETTPQSEDNVSRSISPPIVLNDGTRTSYADIVDKVAPAVVKVNSEIRAKKSESNPLEEMFGFPQQSPRGSQNPVERGMGSGVIVGTDGTILTNNHVIDGATKIKIELNDRRVFEAKVIGTDAPTDLAVLKVEAKDLPSLPLGDSEKVRVGDIILAIGNPLGIGQTVTAGIVSAKSRRTNLGDGSFEDFLQIDAPINRGNSGGALVSLTGELIGINSQILSPSGGNIGIGFSIPSNMAKSVMEQLLKDGKVRRGRLGVGIQNVTEEFARSLDLKENKGVLVNSVASKSAAEKAGIKRGDVILAINGEKIDDGNTLRNKVAQTAPGTQVALTILRDGKEQEIKATLDELQPENTKTGPSNDGNTDPGKSSESGKLGLELQPLTQETARRLQIPEETKGLLVTGVDPEGPAAAEGISRGDVILEINRQEVGTFEEAQAAIERAGDRPSLLLIVSKGQTGYVTIEPKN